MAKGHDSWNKKEREQQRLKAKKQKEERKKERRENAQNRHPDDMMAYVDEEGNISPTPPDPLRRKEIRAEDIEIGVPKQVPPNPADLIRKGTVTFFNEAKGYGFIKDSENQQSVFVHVNNCHQVIQEKSKVVFEIEMGPKGPSAVNVTLLEN